MKLKTMFAILALAIVLALTVALSHASETGNKASKAAPSGPISYSIEIEIDDNSGGQITSITEGKRTVTMGNTITGKDRGMMSVAPSESGDSKIGRVADITLDSNAAATFVVSYSGKAGKSCTNSILIKKDNMTVDKSFSFKFPKTGRLDVHVTADPVKGTTKITAGKVTKIFQTFSTPEEGEAK